MAWGNDHARWNRMPRDWQARRDAVLRRDPVCRICQAAPSTDVDHIVPMADDHRLEALQGLCRRCHQSKTGRDSHARRPRRQRPAERHPGVV